MTEPKPKSNGRGWATREIAERVRSIAKLEVELALLEVKQKLAKLGIGAGLGAGAALLLLYAIGVFIAAGAVALALVVPLWAALLIVGGVLLLLIGLLVWLAIRSFKAGAPPLPEGAIEEAKLTTDTLLSNDG
jgi:Flp pilus assembly protein TadB